MRSEQFKLRKSHVEARNQINAILTPERRKGFRQCGPRWMRGEDEGGE